MNEVPRDPWQDFRRLTAARIALGRTGASLPTRELLDFGIAHARARDAVRAPFDAAQVCRDLTTAGLASIVVESNATHRGEYLRRPDLGRSLSATARQRLVDAAARSPDYDLAIIISDGLSAVAAQQHAPAIVTGLVTRLAAEGWTMTPVVVARFGRVALADEIGALLHARIALILIGERPGLGSPDSLGAYFIYGPRAGRTDADRNCVSNIRPDGLPYTAALEVLQHLLTASRHRRISGVQLKDERLLTIPASLRSLPEDVS